MITELPNKNYHRPKYYLLNAEGKTLGRLASLATNLLMGKYQAYFTPSIDQGNYLYIINAEKIVVSGKKEEQKFYYRTSQRPGNLKKESFQDLKERLPSRIIEKAIWGMLPKNVLGRKYYRRLYVCAKEPILLKTPVASNENWITIE